MWKRWVILAVLGGAILLGVQQLVAWRQAQQQRQLEAFAQQVFDGDPIKRLEAAEGLLRVDPSHDQHRLVRARALMALNRHSEAREQLEIIIEKGNHERDKCLALQISSYFTEAEAMLAAPPERDPSRADEIQERCQAFMTGVATQAAKLPRANRETEHLTYETRRRAVLVLADHLALTSRRAELTNARLSGVQQTTETLELQVAQRQKQLAVNEKELADQCAKLRKADPNLALPVEILFHHHLRSAEFDHARDMARTLVAWPRIPAVTVGRLADALLSLEISHAVPVTAMDVDLAGKLLSHPKQTGEATLQHTLARAAYALAAGDPGEAYALAHDVLTREGGNARARCIAALASVAAGEAANGVQLLQKYTEIKSNAQVRYALGVAYLAQKDAVQIKLGQEALRQCLDLEPSHLPARLRLIESLSDTGYLVQAADDIAVALAINPAHPRVLALQARLAVEGEDLGAIAKIVDQQLSSGNLLLQPDDVAMVVAMVLDDTARVRHFAAKIEARSPHDVFLLLAQQWLGKQPRQRARLAPAIMRSLHIYLDRDPLANPNRPALPVESALAPARQTAPIDLAAERLEPLLNVHFLPRPVDVALDAVTIALDEWPGTPSLLSAAAELNIWLNRTASARHWLELLSQKQAPAPGSVEALMTEYLTGQFEAVSSSIAAARNEMTPTHHWLDVDLAIRSEDSRRIIDAVTGALRKHPWAELPLLMVVIDALRRDQPDRAYSVLAVAERINPQVANLTRARLSVGLGHPAEALNQIEQMVASENAGTEVRRWAEEVRVRAHLLLDQQTMAVGMLDQLALTLKGHKADVQMAAADVLVEFGKSAGAAELLSQLLSMTDNSPRTLDRLLARAEAVMKPSRLKAVIEMLSARGDDHPVLLLYQARATAHEDDVVAERLIRRVLSTHEGSARALMEMAELLRTVQPDESKRIYRQLLLRGGRSAEAAQRMMDPVNLRQAEPPVSANLEGAIDD